MDTGRRGERRGLDLTATRHRLQTMSPFEWAFWLLRLTWHWEVEGVTCPLGALVSVHALHRARENCCEKL